MGMWAAGADPKRGALTPKCCLQGGAVSRAPQKGAVFTLRTGLFFPLYDRLEFPFCPSLSSRKFGVFPSDFGPFPPSTPYTLEDLFHAPFGSFSPLTPLRTFFTLHLGPFPPLYS